MTDNTDMPDEIYVWKNQLSKEKRTSGKSWSSQDECNGTEFHSQKYHHDNKYQEVVKEMNILGKKCYDFWQRADSLEEDNFHLIKERDEANRLIEICLGIIKNEQSINYRYRKTIQKLEQHQNKDS